MKYANKNQTRIADYARSQGRANFRKGKSLDDCPWGDKVRVFYYRQGWQSEKRLTKKVNARKSLYG